MSARWCVRVCEGVRVRMRVTKVGCVSVRMSMRQSVRV